MRRRAVKIKSQKDFYPGLLFLGLGIAFAGGALGYKLGTASRMGPGYFPFLLGCLMTGLGLVITIKALVVEAEGHGRIGEWAWRPLVFVLCSNLVFGALLGGLPGCPRRWSTGFTRKSTRSSRTSSFARRC